MTKEEFMNFYNFLFGGASDAFFMGENYEIVNGELIKDLRWVVIENGKEGLYSENEGDLIVIPSVPHPDGYIALNKESLGEGLFSYHILEGLRSIQTVINKNGEVIFSLPKGWRISGKFNDGVAPVAYDYINAKVDLQGNIFDKVRDLKSELRAFEQESQFEIERDYRAAFEDDPGAEWNID